MSDVLSCCSICKVTLGAESFGVGRDGRTRKSCVACLAKRKAATRCPHDKNKYSCLTCGLVLCEHHKRRTKCRVCSPQCYCEHDCQKTHCKECVGARGSQICEHGRQRAQCKPCGGSQICPHGCFRSYCKTCHGTQLCSHDRNRRECSSCDPAGSLLTRVRTRVSNLLGPSAIAGKSTIDLLGCSKRQFYNHILYQLPAGVDRIDEVRLAYDPLDDAGVKYSHWSPVQTGPAKVLSATPQVSSCLSDEDLEEVLAFHGC